MGGAKSMFLQEDSLASLSALQVEERERKIIATSGKKCIEQSKKSTPLGLLVKMLLESRQWWSQAKQLTWVVKPIYSTRVTYIEKKVFSHSSEFVKTSKTLDMKSNRLLYQLVPSGHHIDETGCGLLPTVQTQGLKKCNNKTGRTIDNIYDVFGEYLRAVIDLGMNTLCSNKVRLTITIKNVEE